MQSCLTIIQMTYIIIVRYRGSSQILVLCGCLIFSQVGASPSDDSDSDTDEVQYRAILIIIGSEPTLAS